VLEGEIVDIDEYNKSMDTKIGRAT